VIPAGPNTWSRVAAIVIAALLVTLAAAGPRLTANTPSEQIAESVYAPPMLPHIFDDGGRLRFPFVYPLRLDDRLTHTYSEDRSQPMRLRFFSHGALMSVDPAYGHAWFPLGADALGRDQFARLAVGARLSLGVALAAAAGALLIGAIVGALSGFFGGLLDDGLMRLADLIVALPALYVVLALRAAMPLVLTGPQVFWTLVLVLALVGWPFPARGVRAVVAAESVREYAESARALGASRTRLLLRHLLPAARGFLIVQATLLVPAFILAEATLSYVGLGFGAPISSWGAMLREAGSGRVLVEAPWLLAPAMGIVLAALAVNLGLESKSSTAPEQFVDRF
jgi:peptide/nickel transport system permease protein